MSARSVVRRRTSAARSGSDLAEFAALYADRFTKMARLAYLMTGSSAIAEEIVQEAFVKLHLRWDRVDNPVSYLRQIVVNDSRSYHRRRIVEDRHRPVGHRVELPPELDETLPALAALRPRQRAALVLRYYEDMPMAEIAEALGCRVGTARSLVHRGLAGMKEIVGP